MELSPSKLSLSDCLDVERSCVGLNLRRADRAISQEFDSALRSYGLKNTQFGLLVAVHAMQPAPLSRVAHRLEMDRTTLTRNLAPLERSGLVETARGKDQRERLISLTEKGSATLHTAYPIWKETNKRIRRRMGEQAVAKLIDGLRKIGAAAK
jgi:DNA-binding MarR family transcriptional regulator